MQGNTMRLKVIAEVRPKSGFSRKNIKALISQIKSLEIVSERAKEIIIQFTNNSKRHQRFFDNQVNFLMGQLNTLLFDKKVPADVRAIAIIAVSNLYALAEGKYKKFVDWGQGSKADKIKYRKNHDFRFELWLQVDTLLRNPMLQEFILLNSLLSTNLPEKWNNIDGMLLIVENIIKYFVNHEDLIEDMKAYNDLCEKATRLGLKVNHEVQKKYTINDFESFISLVEQKLQTKKDVPACMDTLISILLIPEEEWESKSYYQQILELARRVNRFFQENSVQIHEKLQLQILRLRDIFDSPQAKPKQLTIYDFL